MGRKISKQERFESIYEIYKNDIFRISMHYTKDYMVSQEITQNVFMQLYLHMDRVNPESIRAWLTCTAKNLIYNYTRDSKYEILSEKFEDLLEQTGKGGSIEEYCMEMERTSEVNTLCRSILGRLYQEHKIWYEVLVLVYGLEKPQADVADELGITLDVLHSRLYRAKQWIRKNYEKEYREVVNGR